MFNRNLTHILAFAKKQKSTLLPLGTLFVLAVVLGGLLIDSVLLAIVSALTGIVAAFCVFKSNVMLFAYISGHFKKNEKKAKFFLWMYLLILLLVCGGALFMIGVYRFDMLLLTGVVMVTQLFLLSIIEAVKSIRNG